MTTQIQQICARRKPLVVISCTTYNHEKYIADALEGFVMQQTTFPFVAIVHDDASTDGTAAIVRQYAERYPDIILPIYQTENQYSKRDGSLGRIMRAARQATGAKYVALCEGDDYWTAPNKLQIQVDFLEAHPDYSLCFHNARMKLLDGSFDDYVYNLTGTHEYTADYILQKWTIPTASVVFIREQIDNDTDRRNNKFKYGDNVLFLTAAKYGKMFGIDEFMSVYRKQPGSLTTSVGPIKWAEINIEHLKIVDIVFGKILSKNLCKYVIADEYIYLIRRHRTSTYKIIKYFIKAISDVPIQFIEVAFKTWILRRGS